MECLRGIWKLSREVGLSQKQPLNIIGLELERDGTTGELYVHQATFVRQLLRRHGLDEHSKGINTVQMPVPTKADLPPTPEQLKKLQGIAGELNWLATRTRSDLAYFTSVLASTATIHGEWSLQLGTKGPPLPPSHSPTRTTPTPRRSRTRPRGLVRRWFWRPRHSLTVREPTCMGRRGHSMAIVPTAYVRTQHVRG